MHYTLKDNRLYLDVKVVPNSRKNMVEGIKNNRLVIRINAQPEKGKANKELIKLLSREYHISKSSVRIIHGMTSKYKTIELPSHTESYFKVHY
jgi:uncharacterized protein (TIGR00251 family)